MSSPLSEEQTLQMGGMSKLEAQYLEALVKLWEGGSADKRWLSVAKTHIEEATMAARRAIAKPVSIEFPKR